MRNKGKYAQYYHISPQEGLLNDPNGLSYFKGNYHVFYQLNPYATDHSTKYWGHLTSKDMQVWTQQPIALKSDDWFDKNGVYSGSALVHDQTLYLFYTGNTKDDQGIRTSYQCLATSTDGINFTKHGPILEQAPGFTGHVRDPKVWFDAELDGWWMLLGAQREDETGDTIAYFSKDLKTWDYRGSIFQFEAPLGYMWECPDLVFLTDQVTGQEKAVFIFSPQGLETQGDSFNNIFNTTYLVGTWDNQKGKFIPDSTELIEVDFGFEFYAPQTFVAPDGRVILYAWVGTMEPAVEEAVPSRQDDWIHFLSQPRQLSLRDGKLYQSPLKETSQLAQSTALVLGDEIALEGPTRVQIDLSNPEDLKLRIDKYLTIEYRNQEKRLTFTRPNWLTHENEVRALTMDQNLRKIDLWLDAASVEAFINEGAYTFTQHVYPDQPLNSLSLDAKGAIFTVSALKAYEYQ